MTRVQVMSDMSPYAVIATAEGPGESSRVLTGRGVGYRRHQITHSPFDSRETILDHYRDLVNAVIRHGRFDSAEVATLEVVDPDDLDMLRAVFLVEHTHSCPETRFILSGSACYYIRGDGEVTAVTVVAGDLLCIPAGRPHWFDVSSEGFETIRFVADGAGVEPTGDGIAAMFPTLP